MKGFATGQTASPRMAALFGLKIMYPICSMFAICSFEARGGTDADAFAKGGNDFNLLFTGEYVHEAHPSGEGMAFRETLANQLIKLITIARHHGSLRGTVMHTYWKYEGLVQPLRNSHCAEEFFLESRSCIISSVVLLSKGAL
jgi:hypothetical protein